MFSLNSRDSHSVSHQKILNRMRTGWFTQLLETSLPAVGRRGWPLPMMQMHYLDKIKDLDDDNEHEHDYGVDKL